MQRFFDPDDVIRTGGRMPIIASAIDATKNIGSTMNLGYNIASAIGGDGFRKEGTFAKNIGSVGGVLTSIGGFAVPGAIAGAALGAMSTDPNMVGIGAAAGAGIGFAAPVALGAAGYGAEKIGKGVFDFFKSTVANEAGAASNVASGLGYLAGKLGKGVGKGTIMAVNSNAAAQQVGLMRELSKHIVDFKETAEGIEDVKLGGVGKAMFYGGAVVEAGKKAFNEYNKIHMGQMDGQVRRATPTVPVYADNAGATGDLVFALNRNRRG